MTDGLNEVGKHLKKTGRDAERYARKGSPEYGMGEIARDIFDSEVDYSMTFRTVRAGQSVSANLQFELPPPSAGLGNCCGECYCAICESFYSEDEEWATTLLLKRPYVAGSVRLILADFIYQDGITETDPEAGIIDISNYVFTSGQNITVCYVYAYAECVTDEAIDPDPVLDCAISDSFNRVEVSDWGTSDSGITWVDDSFDSPSSVDGSVGIITVNTDGTGFHSIARKYVESSNLSGNFALSFQFICPVVRPFIQANVYDTVAGTQAIFNYGAGEYGVAWEGNVVGNSVPIILDAGALYNVRMEREDGVEVRVKLWADSDTEPVGWTAIAISSVTASGMARLILRVDDFDGPASSSATVYFDNVNIECNTTEPSVFDNFNRVVAQASSSPTGPEAGAGVASGGYSWNTQGANSQRFIEVDGSNLLFSWTSVTSLSGLITTSAIGGDPWLQPSFTFTMAFTSYKPSGTSNAELTISAPSSYARLRFTMGVDNTVNILPTGDTAFAWEDATDYLVTWEVTFDGLERVKVWKASDVEPDWLVSEPFNDSNVPTTGALTIALTGSIDHTVSGSLSIDYIDIQ